MWIDPLSCRLFKGAGMIPATGGRGPVVLMYHSIEPDNKRPSNMWSVSVTKFREQIELLRSNGWHTARVCDLESAEKLPLRTVIITFDDGYANTFENGFELLLEQGMCATWFIVTRDIGKRSGWTDPEVPDWSILSRHQLRQMAAAGMEIGAHTRTHSHLPELDPPTIWDEVLGSRKDLEDILGLPVTSFAYPYGQYNEDCITAVRKAGYRVACSTRTGWFGSDSDLLQVRRVAVFSHDDFATFARKLAFADNEVGWWKMTKYAAGRIRSRLSGRI